MYNIVKNSYAGYMEKMCSQQRNYNFEIQISDQLTLEIVVT